VSALADELASLVGAVEAAVDRAQAMDATRAAEGRRLGAETRERLGELRARLGRLDAAIRALVDGDPEVRGPQR